MKFRLISTFCLIFAFTRVNAASPKFNVEPVDNFSVSSENHEEFTRLKISVTYAGEATTARLGGITICSDVKCFKPVTSSNIDLIDTSKGSATLVVDATIPYSKIDTIYFDDTAGVQVLEGALKLEKSLEIKRNYQGGEILIKLDKKIEKNKTVYFPAASAVGIFNNERSIVYYDPSIPMTAQLKNGIKLTIPENSLKNPQIFSIGIDDIGDALPRIDIYPYLELRKSATIEFSFNSLLRTHNESNKNSMIGYSNAYIDPKTGNLVDATNKKSITNKIIINKTGVISAGDSVSNLENGEERSYLENDSSATAPTPTPKSPPTCANLLTNVENKKQLRRCCQKHRLLD